MIEPTDEMVQAFRHAFNEEAAKMAATAPDFIEGGVITKAGLVAVLAIVERDQAARRLRDYDDLVATLRRAWLAQGVSQSEIARRMGVGGPVHVSRWLSGDRTALGDTPFELARALGFDLVLVPRGEPS